MVSLTVILFSTKCFLFVYIYIDLLKLRAYKPFEYSDADLSWLLLLLESACGVSHIITRHIRADLLPTSNLVCIKEVVIRTTLSNMINIAGNNLLHLQLYY